MSQVTTNKKPWSEVEKQLLDQYKDSPDELIRALPDRSPDAIRFKLSRLGLKAKRQSVATAEEFERTNSGSTMSVSGKGLRQEVTSLEELVQVCKIDLNVWSVETWGSKVYNGFIKNAKKQVEKVQLFSVSAKLVKRTADDPTIDLKSILEEVKKFAPVYPEVYFDATPRRSRRLLELSLPDLHVGKLAWGAECGEDYDAKIAEELFETALLDLIAKSGFMAYDEVLIVIGNDLLNADGSNNMTTGGTPQSCDGRHQKSFKTVRHMLQRAIEILRTIAPKVTVMIIPGNHDRESCFYLGETLDAWFHNCPEVVVDNRPTLRKYFAFGKVLLGFTHGNEEKPASLPLIMATEAKNLWGNADFCEWHTGHFHQKKATSFVALGEHNGVIVRILPSLCAPEDWHTAKGYIGNGRSAEAYVWDSEEGLVGTAVFNVPRPVDRAA